MIKRFQSKLTQLPDGWVFNATEQAFTLQCADGMNCRIVASPCGKGFVGSRHYADGKPQSAMWFPTWKEVVSNTNS